MRADVVQSAAMSDGRRLGNRCAVLQVAVCRPVSSVVGASVVQSDLLRTSTCGNGIGWQLFPFYRRNPLLNGAAFGVKRMFKRGAEQVPLARRHLGDRRFTEHARFMAFTLRGQDERQR
jgi:hypothetical protein